MFKNKDIYVTDFDYDRLKEMLNKHVAGSSRNLVVAKNLIDEIKRAKKVDSKEISADYVTMNTVFEIKDLVKPDRKQVSLVFPEDADPENGKMSILTPIGIAVLGYRQGEVVKYNTPAGEEYFKIDKIIYQPEAAGDYHL